MTICRSQLRQYPTAYSSANRFPLPRRPCPSKGTLVIVAATRAVSPSLQATRSSSAKSARRPETPQLQIAAATVPGWQSCECEISQSVACSFAASSSVMAARGHEQYKKKILRHRSFAAYYGRHCDSVSTLHGTDSAHACLSALTGSCFQKLSANLVRSPNCNY